MVAVSVVVFEAAMMIMVEDTNMTNEGNDRLCDGEGLYGEATTTSVSRGRGMNVHQEIMEAYKRGK
jgi:hypothetical protein